MSAVRRYMDAVRIHRYVSDRAAAEISDGPVSQACFNAHGRVIAVANAAVSERRRELLVDLRRRADA